MSQQSILPQSLGLLTTGLNTQTFSLNTAASGGFSQAWFAFGFLPTTSDSVNSFRVYLSNVSGTGGLAATDFVCDIYNGAFQPVTSLGSVTLGTALAQGFSGFVSFSFGTPVAVTAYNQYWGVLRNANAAPTTNFPTIQYLQSLRQALPGSGNGADAIGWNQLQSTNSGTNWGSSHTLVSGYRVGYSSGAYQGSPYYASAASTDKAFGSGNELGVKLTLPGPSSLLYNAICFQIPVQKGGAPTGLPQANLYVGASATTPAATSAAWPNGVGTGVGTGPIPFYFTTRQQIPGGSVIRLTLADSAVDSTTNYYTTNPLLAADSDANSLPLAAWDGTAIYTVFNGTTWTDDNTHCPIHGLSLDSTGEFSVSGGGGSSGGFVIGG